MKTEPQEVVVHLTTKNEIDKNVPLELHNRTCPYGSVCIIDHAQSGWYHPAGKKHGMSSCINPERDRRVDLGVGGVRSFRLGTRALMVSDFQ